jgi:MFS family permease
MDVRRYPFFYLPSFTDASIGTIVYKATAPIFMLFLVGAGFSKSYGSLLVCRLLAGLTGGPVLAVGAGSTADMYPAKTRALASSIFIMMPFLGPALGPVIGGFAAYYKGWRWTQWCTIFIGVVAFALVLPLPETYKKVILTRRAKKHGVQGPPKPPVTGWAWMKLMLTVTLMRPLYMLFAEPIVLFLSLYNSFTFSVLFAFFAAYPYTFETVYGFNTWQYGLAFLGIFIGVILAVATVMVLDRMVYMKKFTQALKAGKTSVPPEERLYAAMVGSFGVSIG